MLLDSLNSNLSLFICAVEFTKTKFDTAEKEFPTKAKKFSSLTQFPSKIKEFPMQILLPSRCTPA